ncbi:Cleft lip and palate transmembrane protein [Fasciolopsis buskii]|uniref:Cleft lip and palate transmembrane protein n=1 Tax=Fasciolopsis buskii TaxID=27845 RepID=A0A8E0RQ47_9TREM|nr:Cleft lip and palate transmembrane protein [Fasciolopsis buski]
MDPNRVNEFGVSKEMLDRRNEPENEAKELEAKPPLSLTNTTDQLAAEDEASLEEKPTDDRNVRRRPKVTNSLSE